MEAKGPQVSYLGLQFSFPGPIVSQESPQAGPWGGSHHKESGAPPGGSLSKEGGPLPVGFRPESSGSTSHPPMPGSLSCRGFPHGCGGAGIRVPHKIRWGKPEVRATPGQCVSKPWRESQLQHGPGPISCFLSQRKAPAFSRTRHRCMDSTCLHSHSLQACGASPEAARPVCPGWAPLRISCLPEGHMWRPICLPTKPGRERAAQT